MDGRRQSQSGQQGVAAGMILLPGQGGDNLLGGALLEFLQEAHGSFGGLGSDQQVKVLGHEHPADQKESGFLADLPQSLDKSPAEALTRKEAAAAIGAGGDELHLPTLEMASVDGHTKNIGGHGPKRESQSWARSAPACPGKVNWSKRAKPWWLP